MDALGIVLLLCLCGLVYSVLRWMNALRLPEKLRRNGVSIVGHITYRYEEGRRSGYTVAYRYSYHGSSYARDEKVESEIYSRMNIGDRVGVRCLPEQPKIARLEDNLTGGQSLLLTALPKDASFTEE